MKYWIGYDAGEHIQLLNYVSKQYPGGYFHGGRVIDTEEEARNIMRRMVAPAGTSREDQKGRWSQEEAAEVNLRIIPVPDEAVLPLRAINAEIRALSDADAKNKNWGNNSLLFKEGRRLTDASTAANKVLMAAMRNGQCIPAGEV